MVDNYADLKKKKKKFDIFKKFRLLLFRNTRKDCEHLIPIHFDI